MAHRIGSLTASLLLAFVAIAHAADGDVSVIPCTSSGAALPPTVAVPDDLRRHVESMLSLSAIFRAQCRRIAESQTVRVLIRIDPALRERTYRARTTFARTVAGGLVARVDISLRDPIEWIAHELEHVIEQLDGLSLPALADEFRGVWLSADKMFETKRAIEAGRAVVAEMRRARRGRPPRDTFVE